MSEGLLYWLNRAAALLGKYGWFCGGAAGLIFWFYDVLEIAVEAGLTYILSKISDLELQQLQGVTFATLEWVGYANGILPLSEMLVLCGVYLTAWGTLLGIRWIKSFIPTIAN